MAVFNIPETPRCSPTTARLSEAGVGGICDGSPWGVCNAHLCALWVSKSPEHSVCRVSCFAINVHGVIIPAGQLFQHASGFGCLSSTPLAFWRDCLVHFLFLCASATLLTQRFCPLAARGVRSLTRWGASKEQAAHLLSYLGPQSWEDSNGCVAPAPCSFHLKTGGRG